MKSDKPDLALPEGTVTFLFTDIEGSTRQLRRAGELYADLLAQQRRIVRDCCHKWGGQEVDTQGDSFFLSFPRVTDAVCAAIEIQRSMVEHPWPEGGTVRLRMGLHTGQPQLAEEGYVGLDVHRAARIGSLGHGGQVLLSETTASLVRSDLPEGVNLKSLGKLRLKDFDEPEPISQLIIPGLPVDFPVLKSPDVRPVNLPGQSTPFIGRKPELDALCELISDPEVRLVTIFGAGGMGKTRLALAVGEQIAKSFEDSGNNGAAFPDGIFFVPLASLDSSSQLEAAIAMAIGFRFYEGSEPRDQLLDYLRQYDLLLILDNFEHLLDGTGLVSEIVNTTSQVDVLVTTREKLNIQGERIWPLEGMSYPTAGSRGLEQVSELLEKHSAMKLFQATARRIEPGIEFDEGTALATARICSLVEGMPLAIEIAASWVDTFSVQAIQLEIEKQLDFLVIDARDVADRHRSIRAVFDSTWQLLDPNEKRVFICLSVFRGGFTREAAEFVASATTSALKSLIRKALIKRSSGGRYQFHELIRKYGHERLNSDQDLVEATLFRHSKYYSDLLESREADIRKGDTTAIIEEMDNIISGLKHAATLKKASIIRRQVQSLWWLYQYSGWNVAVRELFEEAERNLRVDAIGGEIGIAYGQILTLLGVANVATSRDAEGVAQVTKSQEILRKSEAYAELAWANGVRGMNDVLMEFGEAEEYFHESLSICEDLGIEWGVAFARSWWGNFLLYHGYIEEAEIQYQAALRLCIAECDRRGKAWSILGLASCEYKRGKYSQAMESFREGFRIHKDIGNKRLVCVMHTNMGDLALLMGDREQAELHYKDALSVGSELGNEMRIAETTADQGYFYLQIGNFERARACINDALKLSRKIGHQFLVGWISYLLGELELGMGSEQESWAHYLNAFELGRENKQADLCLRVLLGIAKLYSRAGNLVANTDTLMFVYRHRRTDPFTRGLARVELENLDRIILLSDELEDPGKDNLDELWKIVDDFLEGKYDREVGIKNSRTG